MNSADTAAERADMLAELREQGIEDPRVLAAMNQVPREEFVPAQFARHAYQPRPLPIGHGQTISTPHIVALMAAALDLSGTERVLEVGAGAGYAAAVLACCAAQVTTIEYCPQLADTARRTLAELGYRNVEVRRGDGSRGAPDRAPFGAISVAAMAPRLPATLLDQLAPGGVLVCPVGPDGDHGQLLRHRDGHTEALLPVRFVPLINDHPGHPDHS